MSIVAHLEPLSKVVGNRRGAPRLVLYLGSMLGPCGSRAVIHDLSFTGLLFESSADLNTGDIIEVHLPQMGPTKTTVVRRDGTLFGCRFDVHQASTLTSRRIRSRRYSEGLAPSPAARSRALVASTVFTRHQRVSLWTGFRIRDRPP